MTGTKFYFAEYEISGSYGFSTYSRDLSIDEINDELIQDYISSEGPVITTSDAEWYFGRPESDPELLYGKFGKVYRDEPIIYDDEEQDFIEVAEPNIDADYSVFVIDMEKNLIIYSSTYRVRHANFKKYFEKGFEEHTSGNLEIELKLLENNDEFEYVIENLPIYGVEAELEPSNPGAEDEWRELDDSMQEMLINKLEIGAEGDDINVDEDFLRQVLEMSQSDYGNDWSITYGDDGYVKVISADEEVINESFDDEVDTIPSLRQRAQDLIAYGQSFLD